MEDPAIGVCPQLSVRVDGETLTGLMDTGSQVTMMSASFFSQHLGKRTNTAPPASKYRLTAANGTVIPYDGFISVDVLCDGVTVPGAVIFITSPTPNQPPFIVGMNILKFLPSFKARIFSSPMPKLSLAHSSGSSELIPAQCMLTVAATCNSNYSQPVLIEPIQGAPPGLVTVQGLASPNKGKVPITLFNPTDQDIILPPRARIGLVQPATVAQVSLTTPEADDSPSVPEECSPSPLIDLSKITLPDTLSPQEKGKILKLVEDNADVFAWKEDQLGLCDMLQHKISVTSETPVAQPYRRIPPSQMAEVRDHLESLLAQEIITPSQSPYASPIVVVRKKNGEIRMCCDFRKLNAITRRDAYPLPRLDECIDALSGAQLFSTLDLASGYHQTEVLHDDREKNSL